MSSTCGSRWRTPSSLAAFATASSLAVASLLAVAQTTPAASAQVGAPGARTTSSGDTDLDTLFDTFDRSDRDLDGDVAPTGHVYSTQRADSAAIVDGNLRFDIPFPHSAILYTRLAKNVESYSVSWRFTDALQHQNMVSGVGPISFGNASMQLTHYASPTDPADQIREGAEEANLGSDVTWLLFLVFYRPELRRNEYIALASNLTHGDLVAPAELDTDYTQGWRFVDDDTVVITLLDGTTRTITDPRLASTRGTRIGTQKRENVADTADLEVLSVTASSLAAAQQPDAGSGLVFDGTPYNYAQTARPTLTSPDLDLTFSVADWTTGMTSKLLSIYGDTGNQTFYVGRNSANATTLGVSVGGATMVATTGNTALPAGTRLVRITRVASTGTITFWTARSDAARFLPIADPSWSVWRTRTHAIDGVPVGALDASHAPLRIGYPVGSEAWLNGTLRYVNVRDGIDGGIVAERDFLSAALQTETDVAGNTWQLIGEAWDWGPGFTVPTAPTVSDSEPAAGAVSVGFAAGEDGGSAVAGYAAQCASTDGGTGRTRTGTSSPLLVTGLTGGKQYHCRVRASNAVGSGPYSRYGLTVNVPATTPDRPALTDTTVGVGAASVAFTVGGSGGSPITGYAAQCVSTDGGTGRTRTGTSSPLLVTGLTGGRQYHCRVRASNAIGSGPYSHYGAAVNVPEGSSPPRRNRPGI